MRQRKMDPKDHQIKTKRKIGRPQKRWLDQMKRVAIKTGYKLLKADEESIKRGICPGVDD